MLLRCWTEARRKINPEMTAPDTRPHWRCRYCWEPALMFLQGISITHLHLHPAAGWSSVSEGSLSGANWYLGGKRHHVGRPTAEKVPEAPSALGMDAPSDPTSGCVRQSVGDKTVRTSDIEVISHHDNTHIKHSLMQRVKNLESFVTNGPNETSHSNNFEDIRWHAGGNMCINLCRRRNEDDTSNSLITSINGSVSLPRRRQRNRPGTRLNGSSEEEVSYNVSYKHVSTINLSCLQQSDPALMIHTNNWMFLFCLSSTSLN